MMMVRLLPFLALSIATVWCHTGEAEPSLDIPPAQEGQPSHEHSHSGRFDIKNVHKNQEHIMAHLDGVINKPESEMNEMELQFHYFKLHDFDHNNKLDGLELIKAMTHQDSDAPTEEDANTRIDDSELSNIVDDLLKDEDINKDGYIEYSEFISAQRHYEEVEKQEKDEESATPSETGDNPAEEPTEEPTP